MYPHLVLGVIALAVSAFCLVAGDDFCQTKDAIQIIQKTCKQEEGDILVAEGDENYPEVCRQFPLLMICAVTALPQCYNNIESTFAVYGHSPFSCELTPQVIKELQEIVRKGTHVTVPPTSTTPATTTSAVQKEQSGATFHTSTFSSSTRKVVEIHGGSNEKHQGDSTRDDGNVVTSNISTMILLLVATPMLRWATS